jgi:hypothetical protein
MIGKGAQYLTAAGFGRYRITAASLGSLDLLGTFGWLMHATKQAIMDAFGADNTAVIQATNEYLNGIAASDKAKATALAAFINEDPMMVCSLGLEPQGVTMPVRWLVNDASGNAYIDTDIRANLTFDIEVSLKYNANNSNQSIAAFGAMATYPPGISFFLPLANGQTRYARFGSTEVSTGTSYITPIGEKHICRQNKTGCYIDGVKRVNYNVTQDFTVASTFTLFRTYGSGSAYFNSETCIEYAKIDGDNKRHFVPCKHKVNGVEQCGMLDLVNLVWYGNANSSGSFTIPDISYTPTP